MDDELDVLLSSFWSQPSDSPHDQQKKNEITNRRFFTRVPPGFIKREPPPPEPPRNEWPEYAPGEEQAPVPQDDPFDPVWPQAQQPGDEGFHVGDDERGPYVILNGRTHYLKDLPQAGGERWDDGYYDAQTQGNKLGRSFIRQGDRHIYTQPEPLGEQPRPKMPPRYRDS